MEKAGVESIGLVAEGGGRMRSGEGLADERAHFDFGDAWSEKAEADDGGEEGEFGVEPRG